MDLNVQVENQSSTVRKLTIRVPAKEVASRFQRGLAEIQRTASLKGFRAGHVPMAVVMQHYGNDVRHHLYHDLVDESFQEAVQTQNLKTVGYPKIESPEHKTGEGEHDHAVNEDRDFTYIATVEVMPEIEVKNYTGVSLARQKVEVTDEDVTKLVEGLRDSRAELVPVGGGLLAADGTQSSRPVQKGDFADIVFAGGLVTEAGIEPQEGMKGNRMVEVGSDSLIPGFEDHLVGMRRGETKSFRIQFPKEFDPQFAEKEAEFTVTINELKEKKLPELNDELAKEMGFGNVGELRERARGELTKERERESEGKVRADLVQELISRHTFEVPVALVNAQARELASNWAEELKQGGLDQKMIEEMVLREFEKIRARAESQVRASLILEAIAAKEKIDVKPEELDQEIESRAAAMKVEAEKLREFYAKNPGRKEDFLFALRQDRTLKFLVEKAKIKSSA